MGVCVGGGGMSLRAGVGQVGCCTCCPVAVYDLLDTAERRKRRTDGEAHEQRMMLKLALRDIATCHVACGGALRRWVRWAHWVQRQTYMPKGPYMPTGIPPIPPKYPLPPVLPVRFVNSTPITTLTMSFVESCPYHTFTCSYQMSKRPAWCVAKIRAVQVENGRVVRETATPHSYPFFISPTLPHSFTALCACALTIIYVSRV